LSPSDANSVAAIVWSYGRMMTDHPQKYVGPCIDHAADLTNDKASAQRHRS